MAILPNTNHDMAYYANLMVAISIRVAHAMVGMYMVMEVRLAID